MTVHPEEGEAEERERALAAALRDFLNREPDLPPVTVEDLLLLVDHSPELAAQIPRGVIAPVRQAIDVERRYSDAEVRVTFVEWTRRRQTRWEADANDLKRAEEVARRARFSFDGHAVRRFAAGLAFSECVVAPTRRRQLERIARASRYAEQAVNELARLPALEGRLAEANEQLRYATKTIGEQAALAKAFVRVSEGQLPVAQSRAGRPPDLRAVATRAFFEHVVSPGLRVSAAAVGAALLVYLRFDRSSFSQVEIRLKRTHERLKAKRKGGLATK